MRARIFHRIDTRISSSFQIPLPHECTKIGGTQTAVAGVDRERVYLTHCVPLGRTNTICKEERWYDANVHLLPLVEHNYYQEKILTP